MPTADADGNLSYDRTLGASSLPEGTLDHLANLHIVQHGLDDNGNGTYDLEALGESPLAQSLGLDGIPAEATFPATCGMVAGAGAAHMPTGGVETGDGSTSGAQAPVGALLAMGGAVVVGAGGVAALRRRAGQGR